MITSQTEFRTALLDPAQTAPKGLRNPGGEQATKRFDVYRNNVAVSLTEALGTAFPVIKKLVGDRFFDAMAGVYLRAHPPQSPVMMFYGEDMPAFLEGFEPAKSVPYLPDMARLELALRQSYHAEDRAAIAPESMTQLAPDSLPHVTFEFAPALHAIASRYPLYGIWAANTETNGHSQTDQTRIPNTPQPTLVTRPEFDPVADPLTPEQTAVLAALMDGQTLGLAIQSGGAGFDLGPLLGLLLSRNAITQLKT